MKISPVRTRNAPLAIPTSTSRAAQRIPKSKQPPFQIVPQTRLWGMHAVGIARHWRGFITGSSSATGALVLPTIITLIELAYIPSIVSLTVSLPCRPRLPARRCTALRNGTIRNRFRLCVSVIPRAGVAALVALMFRRTRARPACLRRSHVWAQNP